MHKKLEFPSCKYQFFSIQVITCITSTLVSRKKAALLHKNPKSVCQLAKFLPYRRASFHWSQAIFPLLSRPRVLFLCIPEEVMVSALSSSNIYASPLKHGRLPLTSSLSSLLLFFSQQKLDKIWDQEEKKNKWQKGNKGKCSYRKNKNQFIEQKSIKEAASRGIQKNTMLTDCSFSVYRNQSPKLKIHCQSLDVSKFTKHLPYFLKQTTHKKAYPFKNYQLFELESQGIVKYKDKYKTQGKAREKITF